MSGGQRPPSPQPWRGLVILGGLLLFVLLMAVWAICLPPAG